MRYTEFNLSEAPMNPGEYNKAIDTGHTKGVLVGYEFEVCMPKETVDNFHQERPQITTEYVDEQLIQKGIFSLTTSRLPVTLFSSLFQLKPGVSGFNSTEEAIDSTMHDSIEEGKKLFHRVPENIRKTAMVEISPEDRADPLAFLNRLGYILYYKFDGTIRNGGNRTIEQIGIEMRQLANMKWFTLIEKFLGGVNIAYEKPSKFFDFDPVKVNEEFGLSDDDDDITKGAAVVLKPTLEKTMGANVNVFTRYHQSSKNMTDWYIEPDGSLHPDDGGDFTAEVVSPPLPAKDAVQALKNFFAMAAQLKLYTNHSTGLHINVSIPATIDLLKLAVFTGDQHVLKKYGRLDNDYAVSVTRDIPRAFQDRNTIVGVDNKPGSNLFGQPKTTTSINYEGLKDIADRISNNHMASISSNGRWISFRHVGGDYLQDYTEIFNVVGRFVRAVIIASDPSLYKNEYAAAVAKLTGAASVKGPGSMSAEIRNNGLPVLELKMVTTNATFDIAISNALQWTELHNTSPIVSPVTDTPEISNAFKVRARSGGPYLRWIGQNPDAKFATCLVYPRDEKSIGLFRDADTAGGIRSTTSAGSYYLMNMITLPADDIRLRKFLQLLRKNK